MSYNRFKLIDKFLHFVDNSELGEEFKLASKIITVWEYFNNRYNLLYTTRQDIAIDESLLLWKGRLSWKQSILTKRARLGFKSFLLCESKSGYIWKSLLYTGKQMTDELPDAGYKYVATKIVMQLMEGIFDCGYTLYIDNWYSSFELSKVLLSRSTDTIGTLRKDRKDLPHDFKQKKLTKGERVVYYEEGTGVMITKWLDKKDVCTMSTPVNDGVIDVVRAGKPKEIPAVISVYNCNMGGVDKSDQMMTSYEVERKRVKQWYKKLFNHAHAHAHVLHVVMGGKLTPLKFRQDLVTAIIEKYSKFEQSVGKHGRGNANPLRLTGRHFPESSTKKNKKHQRRCVVCSKSNIRKETRFICKTCDVGLCAVPCFTLGKWKGKITTLNSEST